MTSLAVVAAGEAGSDGTAGRVVPSGIGSDTGEVEDGGGGCRGKGGGWRVEERDNVVFVLVESAFRKDKYKNNFGNAVMAHMV